MIDNLAWEKELDLWEEKYKPLKNHIDTSSYDKFETYGEELEFVRSQDNKLIWTLVDGDDGNLYIINGYHLVNRVNYFVTQVPCDVEFLEVPYHIFDKEEEEL